MMRQHGLNGHREWRDPDGQLHRASGPAVEWADGEKEWWDHGILGRLDVDPGMEVAHREFIRAAMLGIYLSGSPPDEWPQEGDKP